LAIHAADEVNKALPKDMEGIQCAGISRFFDALRECQPFRISGRVVKVVGLVIESMGPPAHIGELCQIYTSNLRSPIEAEVVGFHEGKTLLMALDDMSGIEPGSEVISTGRVPTAVVGEALLGRVIDGLGKPLDGGEPILGEEFYPLFNTPPSPLERMRITEHLALGVRAVDGTVTCGKGQRLGIFSGSGVGKSTLLGMFARNTNADVNVIALIGERGREVREFVEKDLGPDGLKRSVVVVATSDQAAIIRLRGAYLATTIAEYFRDAGCDVLLMMDSLTRFAMAQREIGLAVGEPPTTRGYTPSVFSAMPKLLERAGNSGSGSITGLYTVLVEADDMNEPISDAARSILDGHIVLSRELAMANHYPAIDVLASISRVMIDVVDKAHLDAASRLREALSIYKEASDLINIGAYVPGSNPKIDWARSMVDDIHRFLKQGISEASDYDVTIGSLKDLFQFRSKESGGAQDEL
jgi:flagellum-specific ATP synthase